MILAPPLIETSSPVIGSIPIWRLKNSRFYDDRKYKTVEGCDLGFNGFVNLTFADNKLKVDYRDVENRKLLEEEWEVDNGILQGKSIQPAELGMTRVADDLGLAIQ